MRNITTLLMISLIICTLLGCNNNDINNLPTAPNGSLGIIEYNKLILDNYVDTYLDYVANGNLDVAVSGSLNSNTGGILSGQPASWTGGDDFTMDIAADAPGLSVILDWAIEAPAGDIGEVYSIYRITNPDHDIFCNSSIHLPIHPNTVIPEQTAFATVCGIALTEDGYIASESQFIALSTNAVGDKVAIIEDPSTLFPAGSFDELDPIIVPVIPGKKDIGDTGGGPGGGGGK
ncbi:MAG: hypothetical protein GY835_10575 [bacterium]|nr:hypothetical protein [bacterium]